MRIFLSFLAIAVLLAVAGFAPSALKSREDAYEQRLLGALKVVERTIEASSDDVRRIGLYAPEMTAGEVDGDWRLKGIVTSSDTGEDPTYASFQASLSRTCDTLLDAVCWRINDLTVGELQLVVAMERVGAIGPGGIVSGPAPIASGGSQIPMMNASVANPDTPAQPDSATSDAGNDETASATPQAETDTTAAASSAGDSGEPTAMTAAIQNKLQELGYNPGPADGMNGPRTVSAILAYQRRHKLAMDGLPSPELLSHLRSGAAQ